MGVGVLFERGGADTYWGDRHALGHALDRSVGIFVDHGGDDHYVSVDGESQGAAVKPFAVAIFADLRGRDVYKSGQPGYVRPPPDAPGGKWPTAFFMDLGGEDVYVPAAGTIENGSAWIRNRFGWGVDR